MIRDLIYTQFMGETANYMVVNLVLLLKSSKNMDYYAQCCEELSKDLYSRFIGFIFNTIN